MNLVERFLRYVSFDTQSDENSGVTPSTQKQMVFAQYLKGELDGAGRGLPAPVGHHQG